MLAEACLVDRKLAVEWQQHRRNDAVGDVALVPGHESPSVGRPESSRRDGFSHLVIPAEREAREPESSIPGPGLLDSRLAANAAPGNDEVGVIRPARVPLWTTRKSEREFH